MPFIALGRLWLPTWTKNSLLDFEFRTRGFFKVHREIVVLLAYFLWREKRVFFFFKFSQISIYLLKKYKKSEYLSFICPSPLCREDKEDCVSLFQTGRESLCWCDGGEPGGQEEDAVCLAESDLESLLSGSLLALGTMLDISPTGWGRSRKWGRACFWNSGRRMFECPPYRKGDRSGATVGFGRSRTGDCQGHLQFSSKTASDVEGI